jgi:hypothetical protein
LAVQAAGDLGEVPGELGRDDVARVDAAAVGAFEGADLRGLDAPDVAMDLCDRSLLFLLVAKRSVETAQSVSTILPGPQTPGRLNAERPPAVGLPRKRPSRCTTVETPRRSRAREDPANRLGRLYTSLLAFFAGYQFTVGGA